MNFNEKGEVEVFTIVERRGELYAMYDFTLDELKWLLEYVPHNDSFAKDLSQGIHQLEQAEFDRKGEKVI